MWRSWAAEMFGWRSEPSSPETLRQGVAGWLQDDLALFQRPWGCDLAAVTAQTLLLYGVDDVVVPASHGDA